MRRPVSSIALLVVIPTVFAATTLGAACSTPPPAAPVVATASSSAPPPPPPPVRARWTSAHPTDGMLASIRIDETQTLYAGVNGRRIIMKTDGSIVEAPTLVLETVDAILKDDQGRYVFVARDGDAFVSKNPLGEIEQTKPGPFEGTTGVHHEFAQVTAGQKTLLGVTRDGLLMVSTDFGTSWKKHDYTGGNKTFGQATSVALDGKGNGLLIHVPQKLFITHDDGATWKPMTGNGDATTYVQVDGEKRLYVRTIGTRTSQYSGAFVEGDSLKATDSRFTPVLSVKRETAPSTPGVQTSNKTLLVGDKVVEFQSITKKNAPSEVHVTSRSLGEKPGEKSAANEMLSSKLTKSVFAYTYGNSIIYLKEDPNEDPNDDSTSTFTTLLRSDDFGATWQKDAQLTGTLDMNYPLMAVGPKGWMYTTRVCVKPQNKKTTTVKKPQKGVECSHRQVRPSGSKAFEDMVSVEEFTPRSFTFDEPHEKVYVLGEYKERLYVYESPLGQNKFTRTKLLDAPIGSSTEMTVDKLGTIRVMHWESSNGGEWILTKRDAEGKLSADMHLPLGRGTLALTGSHGLLMGSHKTYETADGGDTWVHVPGNGTEYGQLQCNEAGCIMSGSQRVGWDLPAYQSDDKVAASPDAVKKAPLPKQPVLQLPRHEAVALTCKPAGQTSSLAYHPSYYGAYGSDVRWMSPRIEADDKVVLAVGTKTASREYQLLGPNFKAKAPPVPVKPGQPSSSVSFRQGLDINTSGAIAIRYSFASEKVGGNYNPVDAEIAWWSTKTNKVVHHTLTKLKPFRVFRSQISGTAAIIDGGLVFQGAPDDVLHFIHDDGKVETFTLPPNTSVHDVAKAGNRWYLLESQGGAAVLTHSDDGRQWSHHGWNLSETGWSGLGIARGKPYIEVNRYVDSRSVRPLYFALDVPLSADAPAVQEAPEPKTADERCDPQDIVMHAQEEVPEDSPWLSLSYEGADKKVQKYLTFSKVSQHTTKSGVCTSAYHLESEPSPASSAHENRIYLYPEESGWSAWRFSETPDPKNKERFMTKAEPLNCVVAGAVAAKK